MSRTMEAATTISAMCVNYLGGGITEECFKHNLAYFALKLNPEYLQKRLPEQKEISNDE